MVLEVDIAARRGWVFTPWIQVIVAYSTNFMGVKPDMSGCSGRTGGSGAF